MNAEAPVSAVVAAQRAGNVGLATTISMLPALIVTTLTGGQQFCPTADWSTHNAVSQFRRGPCLGVSGIGTIPSPQKTIYVIDRTDYRNTYMKLPSGLPAYAQEIRLSDNKQRPIDIKSNAFCSSGQFMPDGSLVVIGGYPNTKFGYEPGAYSIRRILPGGQFSVVAQMTSARWYPTTQILPDGRMIIVGGSIGGGGLNNPNINNPTLEYYPRRIREGNYRVPFLVTSLPYNMYPFVHLLPSGRIFLFAYNQWTLWDTSLNQQVGGIRFRAGRRDVSQTYPLTGTSAMFQLSSKTNWEAEIIVCGGGPKDNKPADGLMNGKVFGPAWQFCHRFKPEDPAQIWYTERMAFPRVMPQAVLLPDNTMLVMNGAQTGFAGVPLFASTPAYTPELYDCRLKRFTGIQLATSNVPRMYHASAFLAHDGTVFVSGGNPNQGINLKNGIGSTQFMTEYFYPPYLAGRFYPKLMWAPRRITTGLGRSFQVDVLCQWCIRRNDTRLFSVVMAYPGFSTHSFNHGMRNVELDVVRVIGAGPAYKLVVRAPPNKNIAPPTWYWLFVLAQGKPNREGHVIWVNNA